MTNFCFSHSVFYLYRELSAIFIEVEIVSAVFQFGKVQKLSFGKGLSQLSAFNWRKQKIQQNQTHV